MMLDQKSYLGPYIVSNFCTQPGVWYVGLTNYHFIETTIDIFQTNCNSPGNFIKTNKSPSWAID